MSLRQIIGWSIIFIGLGIIIFALASSYNIFTGKRPVPEIFKAGKILSKPASKEKISLNPESMANNLQKMIGEQVREMLPPASVSKTLNLISWSILASILIFGGGQVAGLGIKLLKG